MKPFEQKQFGKYVLLDKLAVGGMAEIYKAKTYGAEGFEKLLAIKRILPHAAADKEFITMLIDEAKLSVLLSHANIVQVYDLGKVGNDYFISMEYIHGVNLRDVLYALREKNKKMPTDLAIYVASEVCKGLDYAHRKSDANNQPLGLVHRDISPQNILISFEGEVKIVDFGIAKAAMNISHTMAGILKGKIAYMSPEQAMGKTIDARTDIFSLGILLYEALTGKKLYTGESQFEVLKKIRTMRIDAARLPESIPEALKPILAKALSYRPEDRYAQASDMQVALTKYLYATFTGFSPRKLAGFVRELFPPDLGLEKTGETKAGEGKTSSISLLGGGEGDQENIVHRETVSPRPGAEVKIDATHPVVTGKSITVSETLGTVPHRKPPVAWILPIVIVLGLGGFVWQQMHPAKPSAIPTTAATRGTLHLLTTPSGAAVTLNGEQTPYKTPAILDDLELGRDYNIGVVLADFGRVEKTVRLDNGDPLTLNISLQKNPGILNIISEPSGAAILVNGIATGQVTPSTLENLELNREYRVSLSKPDYKEFEQPVTLLGATPQKLLVSLKPIELPPAPVPPPAPEPIVPPPVTPVVKETPKPKETAKEPPKEAAKKPVPEKPKEPEKKTASAIPAGEGTVRVVSSPSGADVFINGEHQGTTPVTARARSGVVKILVNGGADRLPCKKTVQLMPGASESVRCSLGALHGKIEINSSPAGATVYLNGKKLGGRTPLTITKVRRDQRHTLKVEAGGFTPWERTFDLDNDETKSFNIDLEK